MSSVPYLRIARGYSCQYGDVLRASDRIEWQLHHAPHLPIVLSDYRPLTNDCVRSIMEAVAAEQNRRSKL